MPASTANPLPEAHRSPSRYDPLLCDFPLPLHRRFHPMGYTVEIVTNSEEVLAAAAESWGCYRQASFERAVTFRIAVRGHGGAAHPAPVPLGQEHLVSIVQNAENFAICDLSQGFTFANVTTDTAAAHAGFRYHYLEPCVYLMLQALYLTPLHASCVALDGRAVVLCGDSGSGKTSLAYACARRGWTYLSDDSTSIVRGRSDYTVVGRPYSIRFRESAQRLFPELRDHTPSRRPSGKVDFEIRTEDLGIPAALEARAKQIVFLNRVAGLKTAVAQPFPRQEARRRLEQFICVGDKQVRAAQRSALIAFLHLPSVQLDYESLTGAERALRTLVQGT